MDLSDSALVQRQHNTRIWDASIENIIYLQGTLQHCTVILHTYCHATLVLTKRLLAEDEVV